MWCEFRVRRTARIDDDLNAVLLGEAKPFFKRMVGVAESKKSAQ